MVNHVLIIFLQDNTSRLDGSVVYFDIADMAACESQKITYFTNFVVRHGRIFVRRGKCKKNMPVPLC